MKKILIVFTILISLVGINKVSALDMKLNSSSDLDKFHEMFTDEEFSNNINMLISEYKSRYYTTYPYYFINLYYSPYGFRNNGSSLLNFRLYFYKDFPTFKYSGGGLGGSHYMVSLSLESSSWGYISLDYKSIHAGIITSEFKDTLETDGLKTLMNQASLYRLFEIDENSNPNVHLVNHFYYSNFDLVLNSLKKDNFSNNPFIFTDGYDNILVPNVSDNTIYTFLSLKSDNLNYHFDNLYFYDDKFNTDIFPSSYTEINLNDYAYVALALKNYNQDPFSTTVQVKGQYCITPVYDYGMKPYDEVMNNKVQNRCSLYYDSFTPVRSYILDSELKNHAIYYLKAYDTTKENIVKIDTSIFDVTLISEENKDNPYVTVNGKTYPTIPYDNLPSSATKNEEENYVPGASEEFSFSDIFTKPLEFLQNIWNSITNVFNLINTFILLLPEPLQYFLYISFTLAICLGLIKIIL